jgi:hypothetical protein
VGRFVPVGQCVIEPLEPRHPMLKYGLESRVREDFRIPEVLVEEVGIRVLGFWVTCVLYAF